jgi:hypothetical protein
MTSNHRTQFLFMDPINPPSELPIEDAFTEKVDFICSQLEITSSYRGWHNTRFGKLSDSNNYTHKEFPIVSNSLAPYYIRFHRSDVSEKELNWINELYLILKNPNYYSLELKPIYYLKIYEKSDLGYGNALTYAVKAIGNQLGMNQLLAGTFYEELTESAFNELIKDASNTFNTTIEGCELVEVHDVLKSGTFVLY